ncbi:MAG: DNA repair protein RecO [Eubacteriales bacterium]|nr:DNA repair protein RecO [Eubacteriales bacterium]
MPSEALQAIVLRYANYRDHDRMLTLLSPEKGRVDVLARGCRRPKSPLLPAAELFVHGEFMVFGSQSRYTLDSCSLGDTFYPLRLDAYRLTCGMYLLELCQAAAQPDQPAQALFALLLEALYHLTYCPEEKALSVTSQFLLRYAALLGYRPRLNHCVRCRERLDPAKDAAMDIEGGGLCCPRCAPRGAMRVAAADVAWMRVLLRGGEWDAKSDASGLFPLLRRYVEFRLETTLKAGDFLP